MDRQRYSDYFLNLYDVRYRRCEEQGSATVISWIKNNQNECISRYKSGFADWVLDNSKKVKGILKFWDEDDDAYEKTLGIK